MGGEPETHNCNTERPAHNDQSVLKRYRSEASALFSLEVPHKRNQGVDAIFGLDAESRIEDWNRGAELIFGYPADEVRGRHVSILWPEDRPHVVGRKRFGRIAIANSDAGAAAFTNQAIDEAHRAVEELFVANGLT